MEKIIRMEHKRYLRRYLMMGVPPSSSGGFHDSFTCSARTFAFVLIPILKTLMITSSGLRSLGLLGTSRTLTKPVASKLKVRMRMHVHDDDDDGDDNKRYDDDDLPPSQVSLILYSPVSAALSAFFTVSTWIIMIIIMIVKKQWEDDHRVPLAVDSLLCHQLKGNPLIWLQVNICFEIIPGGCFQVWMRICGATWMTVPSLSQVTVGGGSPPNQMSYLWCIF